MHKPQALIEIEVLLLKTWNSILATIMILLTTSCLNLTQTNKIWTRQANINTQPRIQCLQPTSLKSSIQLPTSNPQTLCEASTHLWIPQKKSSERFEVRTPKRFEPQGSSYSFERRPHATFHVTKKTWVLNGYFFQLPISKVEGS